MKLSFIVDWWFDVKTDEDNDLVMSTGENGGQEIELCFHNDVLGKRRLFYMIKDSIFFLNDKQKQKLLSELQEKMTGEQDGG